MSSSSTIPIGSASQASTPKDVPVFEPEFEPVFEPEDPPLAAGLALAAGSTTTARRQAATHPARLNNTVVQLGNWNARANHQVGDQAPGTKAQAIAASIARRRGVVEARESSSEARNPSTTAQNTGCAQRSKLALGQTGISVDHQGDKI